MRVLGGIFRGKKITAGDSLCIRPLTNKLKESIFNTLNEFIQGKRILDLFAGSGGFGIEAFSRGADNITFVEKSHRSAALLSENLAHLSIPSDHFQIYRQDVIKYCQISSKSYDLIFTDPPFNFNSLQNLINLIMESTLLERNGLLIIHHEISNPVKSSSSFYMMFKQKRFGRSLISYIIHGVKDV
jgi:16S rRNA (guanine966-N2)-methyltransferase